MKKEEEEEVGKTAAEYTVAKTQCTHVCIFVTELYQLLFNALRVTNATFEM